jgi:hypothetical protein
VLPGVRAAASRRAFVFASTRGTPFIEIAKTRPVFAGVADLEVSVGFFRKEVGLAMGTLDGHLTAGVG